MSTHTRTIAELLTLLEQVEQRIRLNPFDMYANAEKMQILNELDYVRQPRSINDTYEGGQVNLSVVDSTNLNKKWMKMPYEGFSFGTFQLEIFARVSDSASDTRYVKFERVKGEAEQLGGFQIVMEIKRDENASAKSYSQFGMYGEQYLISGNSPNLFYYPYWDVDPASEHGKKMHNRSVWKFVPMTAKDPFLDFEPYPQYDTPYYLRNKETGQFICYGGDLLFTTGLVSNAFKWSLGKIAAPQNPLPITDKDYITKTGEKQEENCKHLPPDASIVDFTACALKNLSPDLPDLPDVVPPWVFPLLLIGGGLIVYKTLRK